MNKCWWFGHKGFKIGYQYIPVLRYDGIKQVDRNVHWCKRCGVIYYEAPTGDYNTVHDESQNWQPPISHLMERNNQTMRAIKLNKIWNQNK